MEQKLAQRERQAIQAEGALQVEAGAALKKMEPFLQVNFESGTWKREGLPPREPEVGWGGGQKMENSTCKSLLPPSKCLRVLKAPNHRRKGCLLRRVKGWRERGWTNRQTGGW